MNPKTWIQRKTGIKTIIASADNLRGRRLGLTGGFDFNRKTSGVASLDWRRILFSAEDYFFSSKKQKKRHLSCEIEEFADTHIRNLRAIHPIASGSGQYSAGHLLRLRVKKSRPIFTRLQYIILPLQWPLYRTHPVSNNTNPAWVSICYPFLLFAPPIYHLRTFYLAFPLPRRNSAPGPLSRLFSPLPTTV